MEKLLKNDKIVAVVGFKNKIQVRKELYR